MPNIDCPHCGAKPMATGNVSTVFVHWKCGTPIRGQQAKTCRILQLEGEIARLEDALAPFAATPHIRPISAGGMLWAESKAAAEAPKEKT